MAIQDLWHRWTLVLLAATTLSGCISSGEKQSPYYCIVRGEVDQIWMDIFAETWIWMFAADGI